LELIFWDWGRWVFNNVEIIIMNIKIAAIPFSTWEKVLIPNANIAGRPLASILNAIIIYIFPIAGFVLLFYFVYAGYTWLTSMGDPKKIQSAKDSMTNALVGFIIIFLAYWVVRIVGRVLGINVINLVFR